MERLGSIDHGKDFASSVEEIINQPLTVENIDTYADDALSQLIQLVNETVQAYEHQPTILLKGRMRRLLTTVWRKSASYLAILLTKRSSS